MLSSYSIISVTSTPRADAILPAVAGLHVPLEYTLQIVGIGKPDFFDKSLRFNSALAIAISSLLLLIFTFHLFTSFLNFIDRFE